MNSKGDFDQLRPPAWSGASAGARSAGSAKGGGAIASGRSSGEPNLPGSRPRSGLQAWPWLNVYQYPLDISQFAIKNDQI